MYIRSRIGISRSVTLRTIAASSGRVGDWVDIGASPLTRESNAFTYVNLMSQT